MRSFFQVYGLFIGLIALGVLHSGDAAAVDFSGDFRVHAYTESWRDTRAGDSTNNDGGGVRLRLRLREDFTDQCRFQTRFAANADRDENDFNFYIRGHRDSGTEVNPGTATLDEFFVRCRSADEKSEWRIGRMQSNHDLPHMASRSFDRSQASSVNIGWTDGIAYRYTFDNGWYADGMLQYNSRDGNGQTFRGPISFDDSGARVGFFGILGSDEEIGPVFMRALSVTVYPDALAPQGISNAKRDDYILAAYKMGAGWDLGESGRRLVAVGELAYALNTPERAALGLPGSGDAGAFGWQAGLDLRNIFPKHSMGINYGQSEGGMLISNDFRQNNELFEFRWQWQYSSSLRFEFRYRWRYELDRRIDAPFRQRDRDIRFRTTWRF